MIYAPRDESEARVVQCILRASARYMTGGKEIK